MYQNQPVDDVYNDVYNKEMQKQAKELGPCEAIEVTELAPRKAE